MEKYLNSVNSGIVEYEYGDEYITVRFNDGTIYTYSYSKAGHIHVENMKKLAFEGKGLCTYINKFTKILYD